ncbi:ATP-binding protein [Pontibacillus litoralis]|uniref:YhaN AAA domain-containing protein n=1 Tax=Pontibacillus litoralis JSM 072002 TaxID=1385512 RepID=A0A0A5FWU9_9BACI|nr:AAA family ATPase [Pontibacillus litoralis]KGX85281.1 hypothetical protein N784_09580 [Pontibacillus litoralis JSM 072002]
MKIEKAQIYGFGKWQQQTISFSPEGLSYIYGKNEAGKSTLHQFMLYILFDLPPRKRKAFQPLRGNVMGGKLYVRDEQLGFITIERQPEQQNGEARCYLEDGQVHGEAFLKQLLNGVDRATYESIFSFDLQDIQHIHQLDRSDLGNILFGIGMTGSQQIHIVEKQLEKELEKRFKKQGRKPQINEQLALVKQKEQAYVRAKEREAHYHTWKQKEQDLKEQLEHGKAQQKKLENKMQQLEKHYQAAQPLYAYQQLEKELATFDEDVTFPEQGLERYEHLKDQLLPFQSELEVVQQNLATYEQKQSALPQVEQGKLALLEDVLGQKERMLLKREELKRATAKLVRERERWEQDVEALGIGLKPEDMEQLHFPFYIEEHWQQLFDQKKQLQFEQDQLQQQYNTLHQQLKHMQERREQLEQTLLSEEAYAECERRVRLYEQKQEQDKVIAMQHEYRHKTNKLTKQVMMIGLLVAIVSFIVGFVMQEWFVAIGGVFVAVLAIVMGKLMKRSLPKLSSDIELVSNDVDIRNDKDKLLHHKNTLRLIEQEQMTFQQIEREQIKWDERNRSLQHQSNRHHQQMQEQLDTYPFLHHIDIGYWEKTYKKITHLCDELEELKKQEQDEKALVAEWSTLMEQLQQLTKREGILFQSPFDAVIEQLEERWQTYVQQLELQRKYEEWIENAIEQRKQLHFKMKPYQSEIALLFQKANVDNEEAYVDKGKRMKWLEEIKSQMQMYYEQLQGIFFDETIVQSILEKRMDGFEVKREYEEKRQQLSEWTEKIERIRQQLSDVSSQLSMLEDDETVSQSRHELEGEKDLLVEQAKEWSVYQVAYSLLQDTKSVYQKERMPSVLKYCQRYFAMLTNDTYESVFLSEEQDGIVVQSKAGDRFSAQQLSQGTKEQLYVSLRLALSKVMSDNHSLPFIIDDAYVNFDEERTKEFITLLQRLSKEQQIILFTSQSSVQPIQNKKEIIFL